MGLEKHLRLWMGFAISWRKTVPWRCCCWAALPRPAYFACICLDIDFLLGRSAFWNNPRGIVGHSWADISNGVSGYTYFQRDSWQLPLFHVSKLGAPTGTNITFTDGVPWVSLAGRLAFQAIGVPVNLLGVWTAFCFVASAMTLTALVATLGQRNVAAAAMASVTGLCMPALLARWGHMSLMAQFEIPLALIFYLRNNRSDKAWRLFLLAAALTWLALWTFPYLFIMVSAIVFVTIAQAVGNRTLKVTHAALLLAGLAMIAGAVVALSGHLESHGGLGAEGVGVYSMNLLSPFVPQRSGVFPELRDIMADATGGQYEGFSYLGLGVVMLLLMTLPWQVGKLREGVRHQDWMGGLLLCFTLFALSNIVYLGGLRLVDIPLPGPVLHAAAMFRSTGRFFWPVMWSMAALAIAAPIPFYGRYGALLLCLAIPLQWIDSQPLRQALAMSTRAPTKPHIDLAAWQSEIARHNSVRVLPQYACLKRTIGWNAELAVQLQLLAALANRPINTVYAARFTADCPADQRIDGTPQAGRRQLSVFLDEFAGFARMRQLADTSSVCRAGPGIVVCSDDPKEAGTLAALAMTDQK